jgi:glutamyl-Q tRNA(Asp) synthetase
MISLPENDMTRPVFRFAPSPTGLLHLGHAYSALLNLDMAKSCGGRLLLRIEDIDTTRCRPEFVAAIEEDLRWLGLSWETPVRRQSAFLAAYGAALARLDAAGLLYPSFETRAQRARLVARSPALDAQSRDPDGAPLVWRPDTFDAAEAAARIAAGEAFALRLDMREAVRRAGPLVWDEIDPSSQEGSRVSADPLAWGDVVLQRKDIAGSYHVAVVVDDGLQGVTHVVRGQDLYQATSVHRLLQALLGLPAPTYHHHRLIRDAEGQKLAKTRASTALRDLRRQGFGPADVRRMVGL